MRGSDASLEIVDNIDKPCASKVAKRLPGESEGSHIGLTWVDIGIPLDGVFVGQLMSSWASVFQMKQEFEIGSED